MHIVNTRIDCQHYVLRSTHPLLRVVLTVSKSAHNSCGKSQPIRYRGGALIVSKTDGHCWIQSVPPAVAGGCRAAFGWVRSPSPLVFPYEHVVYSYGHAIGDAE